MNKDYSISFVRCISMIFIILCHVFQYFDKEIAWWLNVGVQLFLFISGWLYSNKKIDNYKKFYLKEFIKILLPYYLYILIITILYYIFAPTIINLNDFFKSLLLCGTLKGLSHLWFIRYIVLCYLLLPFLYIIFNKQKVASKTIFKLFMLFFCFELLGLLSNNFINGTWINCFILGFFINKYKSLLKKRLLPSTMTILSLILIIAELLIKYYFRLKFQGIFLMFFNKYCNICHLLLCVLLFFTLKKVYSIFYKNKVLENSLDFTDKYSYYIYLTHHIFILGKISFFNYIDNVYIAFCLVIIATFVSAYLLFLLSDLFKKLFNSNFKYL